MMVRNETESRLVSVVMPARDAADTIAESIDSVRAQTYSAWELIVVDDGSRDATAMIVERLAHEDTRIRLLRVEGETGLPARARNLGMAHARGEYIAFLDADDLWAPEKLARQTAHLERHPEAAGACCWFGLFGDAGRMRKEVYRMHEREVCSLDECITGVPFFTLTLMMRRRCFVEMGGMDEDPRLRGVEDAEYFTRLVASRPVHRLREVLAHYRLRPGDAPSLTQEIAHRKHETLLYVTDVLASKGVFSQSDLARRRTHLHYARARDNLHHFAGPFRRGLMRAVFCAHPSRHAALTLALSFLPRPWLSRLLLAAQSRANARKRRRFGLVEERDSDPAAAP